MQHLLHVFEKDECRVDYVSIVHIPNFLADSTTFTITLIGGVQAAGTRASTRLMADKATLSWIEARIPAASAWQAVVRTKFQKGRLPHFSPIDVAPIAVNQNALATWRESPPSF